VRARAVRLLEPALKSDDAAEVRSAAAVALGDLRAVETLPTLLVAIEDADVHVRQVALNALGEIGDRRALPRLARALADSRPEMRYQAIIAYAKVATDASDVDAALARACGDVDEAVRYIALRIAEERLDRAGGQPASDAVLAEARARVVKDSPHVMLAAAILLAKVGKEPLGAAREVLLRVVRGGKIGATAPDKEDEREAVELAGAIALREAIPDLERRAWGLGSMVRDTCAWHAKIALARMGHARAEGEILADLDSPSPERKAAAVVAAGRARLEAARARIAAMRASGAIDPALIADAMTRLDAGPRDP
jgi:HEAT repeat protein